MLRNGEDLVFGLDIGTRNVVGTVGYKKDDEFYAIAQCNIEHETRSMLDGQIADINRVGKTIEKVKENLEEQIGEPLKEVCIAAAGRVLKTEEVHVEEVFEEETVVTKDHIHNLDLMGVEQAQRKLNENNDTKFRFYCVGYSVVRYYYNDDPVSNPEGHKAEKIGADIIATFLPEDVVDGLYSAVSVADLSVANLTLEPIAAINVAIPENFRLLNIALIDVGAGTSDICITRDGSIIAYGMIPHAGDELTELIVQKYLVDFQTAEYIKLTSTFEDKISFKDILLIEHEIPSKEIWELVDDTVDMIAGEVSDKIKELNGDKSVSACFVVGGGGKIHGFTEKLAKKLDLINERVALRGEEVLGKVHFAQEDIKKDPLLVTPIGICLNYYEQKNNFIFVRFNGELMKLYDNNALTVMDAVLAADYPTEQLFPRRGTELNFFVNGHPRIVRGEAGEGAVIMLNGKEVNMSAPIASNADIEVIASTAGCSATHTISDLKEYTKDDIQFIVNGRTVVCPKFVEVNGSLEPASYEVKEGDRIELRNYYTVGQLKEFMDLNIDTEREILVNNLPETMESLIYENFSVTWTVLGGEIHYDEPVIEETKNEEVTTEDTEETVTEFTGDAEAEETYEESNDEAAEDIVGSDAVEEFVNEKSSDDSILPNIPVKKEEPKPVGIDVTVTFNGKPVTLSGRDSYMYVDIFDAVDFDIHASNGRGIETLLNGKSATYTQTLKSGDVIEVNWKEKKRK